MKITIIGTGYVGLVTGACLAEIGHDVFCLDVDPRKIEILNNGGVPIHEPGLQEMIARTRAAGRITFSTDVAASVAHGDVQFVAVGTPPDEDGSADLQYVLEAARNIGRTMNGFKVIVDKSTVPVGTAQRVRAVIEEELAKRGLAGSAQHRFSVVSNPEFLKEGAAVDDFMRPDRIVIGIDEDEPGVRTLAADVLRASGYRVLTAESGEEALAVSAQHGGHIDVLLTDLIMPGITGRELAIRLSAIRPGVGILYMSGYAEDVIAHRGKLEHGVAFLAKPFAPVALLDKVREVIAHAAVP